MNVIDDAQNGAPISGPSTRDSKRALAAGSEYISRVLAAGGLTMWGALNLMVSLKTASAGGPPDGAEESGPWWITGIFIVVTALLPFVVGLSLFRRLYLQTNVRA